MPESMVAIVYSRIPSHSQLPEKQAREHREEVADVQRHDCKHAVARLAVIESQCGR